MKSHTKCESSSPIIIHNTHPIISHLLKKDQVPPPNSPEELSWLRHMNNSPSYLLAKHVESTLLDKYNNSYCPLSTKKSTKQITKQSIIESKRIEHFLQSLKTHTNQLSCTTDFQELDDLFYFEF